MEQQGKLGDSVRGGPEQGSLSAHSSVRVLIAGPTVNGFFVYNSLNYVWDGESWRGFGMPDYFRAYKDAFKAAQKAKRALGKNASLWAARATGA